MMDVYDPQWYMKDWIMGLVAKQMELRKYDFCYVSLIE